MKIKQILLLVFTSVVFFIIGSFSFQYYLVNFNKNDHSEKPKQSITEDKESIKPDLKISDSEEIDFSKILKGKFTLKGSQYAGYEFIDAKTVSWTNELFPMDPDTMRLNWINENTFVAAFENPIEKCPPVIWIQRIESYDGRKLMLKEVNIGWAESEEGVSIFHKDR